MRTNFKIEKFMNEDEYITMTRGDTFSFGFEIYELDENNELVLSDQELDSVYFTCKQNYTDEYNAFQKSLEDGISNVGTGQYVVRIAPEDTKDLEAGKYFYDLEISANSDVFTFLKGVLEIEHDVTR